jgi:SAM-dependent methyltransferase
MEEKSPWMPRWRNASASAFRDDEAPAGNPIQIMSTGGHHKNDTERLAQLVDESIAPPARGELSPIKRAVRRVTVRAARPHALHQQEISRELLAAVRRLESGDASIQPQLDELRSWLQAERNGVSEVSAQLKALTAAMEQLSADVESLRDGLRAVADRSARAEARTAANVPLNHGSTLELETFDAGPAGTVVGFREQSGEPVAPADGVYVGFEDFFRGSEHLIRDRQRSYLQIVAGHGPVLDFGCGRGEFLEVLREEGIEAGGVDSDPYMVARCREKGLTDVEQGDGLDYLSNTEPDSLGSIFASQVIEHLGFEQLQQLLTISLEKLMPGGLLVVETVNPHNPQALKHFWIDPTHRNPLFPEVVVALCRLTGYAGAYIWHPGGSGDPDRDRAQLADYSVVAQKQGPSASADRQRIAQPRQSGP